MKRHFLTGIGIVCANCIFAQSKTLLDTFKLEGRWIVCTTMTFSKDYNCEKGWTTYEFREDGTMSSLQPSNDQGQLPVTQKGQWKLTQNLLMLKWLDAAGRVSLQNSFHISLLSPDRFYKAGKEGSDGPTVYTFYQKLN